MEAIIEMLLCYRVALIAVTIGIYSASSLIIDAQETNASVYSSRVLWDSLATLQSCCGGTQGGKIVYELGQSLLELRRDKWIDCFMVRCRTYLADTSCFTSGRDICICLLTPSWLVSWIAPSCTRVSEGYCEYPDRSGFLLCKFCRPLQPSGCSPKFRLVREGESWVLWYHEWFALTLTGRILPSSVGSSRCRVAFYLSVVLFVVICPRYVEFLSRLTYGHLVERDMFAIGNLIFKAGCWCRCK